MTNKIIHQTNFVELADKVVTQYEVERMKLVGEVERLREQVEEMKKTQAQALEMLDDLEFRIKAERIMTAK
jgi:hypothetical protein